MEIILLSIFYLGQTVSLTISCDNERKATARSIFKTSQLKVHEVLSTVTIYLSTNIHIYSIKCVFKKNIQEQLNKREKY